ncbi:MAG: hypothetical protein EOO56_12705 [Hymenobacter sp.]|nr:MAG: hypothetical protein EOO56_12705 [Hymenobacter sp.]
MKTFLSYFFGLATLGLSSCSEPCNGHIESTVLYFTEGPNHQGQLVYANVANKPDLGVKHTLMREGKEFGTFGNVVIIQDPQSKFRGRRSVCFDAFTKQPRPVDAPLDETDIPQIILP